MARENDRARGFSRRRAMSCGAAMAALAGAGPAWAGGGGGGGQDPGEGTNSSNPPAKPRANRRRRVEGAVELTQLQFANRAEHRREEMGKLHKAGKLSVEGFSHNMVSWLLDAMLWEPGRTRRLMKDMRRIKDRKKREERLRAEVEKADDLIDVFQSSIDRLEAIKNRSNGQNRALSEERSRKFDMEQYKKAVEVWQRHPHEGTR